MTTKHVGVCYRQINHTAAGQAVIVFMSMPSEMRREQKKKKQRDRFLPLATSWSSSSRWRLEFEPQRSSHTDSRCFTSQQHSVRKLIRRLLNVKSALKFRRWLERRGGGGFSREGGAQRRKDPGWRRDGPGWRGKDRPGKDPAGCVSVTGCRHRQGGTKCSCHTGVKVKISC